MKKYVIYIISGLLLAVIALLAIDCNGGDRKKYVIGISQCSNNAWRDKMNSELRMLSYVNDSVDVIVKSAAENSALQNRQIDSLVAAGVDLLVVSPNDVSSVSDVVAKAYDKGMPVVIFDRQIDTDKFTAFIGSDDYQIGYNLGCYLVDKSDGNARVVELCGLEGSSSATDRHKGFADAIGNSPGVSVVASASTEWDKTSATAALEKLVAQGVKFDYVFSHNDVMADAAADYCRSHGMPDVKVMGVNGLGGSEGGLELVKKGKLYATCLNPTGGLDLLRLSLAILRGEKYNRYNKISTTIVDSKNVTYFYLASNEATRQAELLETLQGRVARYEAYNARQDDYITLLVVSLLTGLCFSVLLYRNYSAKAKLTDELAKKNGELTRMNDSIIELTESRQRFFTNVSHELRTPLTLILDPIERLSDDTAMAPEQHKLLEVVRRNAKALLQLVNDIMDYRKIQAGKITLQIRKFNIAQQVPLWVTDFESTAKQRNIKLRIDTTALVRHTEIEADEEKINRIVFNLVSNAVKYSDAGGSVEISLSDWQDDKVRLTVRDTGKVISAEDQKKVFDRFYQSPDSIGGTGIGLAVVKDFVLMHNGEVSVDSTPGGSTEFSVILPATHTATDGDTDTASATYATEEERETSAAQPADSEVEHTADSGNTEDKPTLLVVDDNYDIRKYIKGLMGNDYTVIEAADGREGLEQALKTVPDLIISDVMMPVMDGLEFCREVKHDAATCHIPVMLLTAKGLDEQKIEGYGQGADSYITKPFSSMVLKARVENLLASRKMLTGLFRNNGKKEEEKIDDSQLQGADKEFVSKLRTVIEQNMDNTDFGVEDIGREMGFSRVQLYRKVKALTGMSPVDILRKSRLQKACSLIEKTEKSIAEIAYEVGFSSPSYFTKCFKDEYDKLPGDLRKK